MKIVLFHILSAALTREIAPPFLEAVLFMNFVLMKLLFFASSSTFIAPPFPPALLFMNVELLKVIFTKSEKAFIHPPSTESAVLLINSVLLYMSELEEL